MISSLKFFGALMVAFGTLTEGVIVPFKDCGSKLGKLHSLDFECNGGVANPCEFTNGKEYHGKISFTPNSVINNGTIVLHGIIGGEKFPFPFPDDNLCKDHGVNCPLKANNPVVVEVILTIPSFAPDVPLLGVMEIQFNKEDVICAEFLAKLVKGL